MSLNTESKELQEMPDYSNERIREIESKLGEFVFEENDESKTENLVTRGPF
jgi:hypothetical protein